MRYHQVKLLLPLLCLFAAPCWAAIHGCDPKDSHCAPDICYQRGVGLRAIRQCEPTVKMSSYASNAALTVTATSSMTITCDKGSVRVDQKTGDVTFHNCSPNEAAHVFWKAIERVGKQPDCKP